MSLTRRVHARWALVAFALVVALAVLGPWRAAAATATPTCSPSKLHLKLVSFQGATGHRFWDFAYKNTGRTCTIKGFPKIVLLDGHGHALSDKVRHLPSAHAKKVTVAHNGRVYFTFQYADSGFCSTPPVVARRFKISLPGSSSGVVFNPVPKNMGAPSICAKSEFVWPLRATAAPSAHDAATPTCSPANLRVDAVGGQGFTGHQQIIFALRNVGATTCRLHAYPGIGLLDSHARLLSPTVARRAGAKPIVTLHTWQRAYFDVVYTAGGPCIPHTLTVYGLQVTPPNDAGHLNFYLGRTVMCGAPHAMVTPVRAHR